MARVHPIPQANLGTNSPSFFGCKSIMMAEFACTTTWACMSTQCYNWGWSTRQARQASCAAVPKIPPRNKAEGRLHNTATGMCLPVIKPQACILFTPQYSNQVQSAQHTHPHIILNVQHCCTHGAGKQTGNQGQRTIQSNKL